MTFDEWWKSRGIEAGTEIMTETLRVLAMESWQAALASKKLAVPNMEYPVVIGLPPTRHYP